MTNQCHSDDGPDLGDLVIVLLAGDAGRSSRSTRIGRLPKPARCVAEIVAIADRYVERLESRS